MTAAAFGANAPASPKAYDEFFFDLEPKIHDLANMTEIARYYAIEYLSGVSPDENEDDAREKSVAQFAIAHVEQMARDLEKAFDAEWRRRADCAPSAAPAR